MKLQVTLALAALAAAPLFAADFGQEFAKHWAIAKDLTIAVANTMPADGYDFKPNPEEMSFGEQMVHIAGGNYSYCARMSGEKSPFAKPEKSDRPTAIDQLTKSFDYCAAAVGGIKNFDSMMGPEGKQIGVREVMLGALGHMAHHRGQAEVYLRVKGLKPPAYKF